MRSVVCLVLGGFLGWIAGSLYPAPQAWLAWVNVGAVEQRLRGVGEAPIAAVPSPAAMPAPAAPSTAAPASGAAVDEQTLNQYRAWISEARGRHPYADSAERMYAVMMCESRGQAGLVNPAGSHSGLFQYSSSTWRGAWNIYRDQSILDPRAQIYATALAWRSRMQGQWGCYTHSHETR